MNNNQNIYNPCELLAKNIDNDFVFLRCSSSGFLASLSILQYLTAEGKYFIGGFYWDAGNMIANNAAGELLFQANETVHIAAVTRMLGDAEIELFRNVVFSGAGNIQPFVNKNFSSVNTPLSVASETPVVTDYGVPIVRGLIAAGEKKESSGGEAGDPESGFFIPPGENILYRVTNLSGSAARLQISIYFTTL